MTRTEIIQAAFETWGSCAYQTTSLAALAGALGVTKTALYHHFRNKDDILGAMYDTFFDSLASSLEPKFERVLASAEGCADRLEILEAFLLLNSESTKFFAENPWYFIFLLVKVHGTTDVRRDISARLEERGLDFDKIRQIENGFTGKKEYPPLFHLIFDCSVCITAYSLKVLWVEGRLKDAVSEITEKVDAFVRRGVGLDRERIGSLDWDTLEASALWHGNAVKGGGRRKRLLKAVACVVAAAGPWDASMSMVARKSGLSKSGLYAHFASKRDMLRQLFLEEFDDATRHAQAVSKKSDVPEEQLYLAIRAVEGFLTSEPEFLAAIASLKTRRINLDMDRMEDMKKNGHECDGRFLQVFSGIKNASGEALIDETSGGVILFLLIDTLIRKPDSIDYKAIPNESFRRLYRFIALGTDGGSAQSAELIL
jgi:AcrR family transcriptional regulator